MKTKIVFYLLVAVAAGIVAGPVAGILTLFALASALSIQLGNPHCLGFEVPPPITGTSLATMDEASVRQLWQDGIDVFDQNSDFFSDMIGGPNALIWEKTDTSKGKGQKITFTVGSGFYDDPHIGEQTFGSNADYEEYLLGSHELVVDWARHGVKSSDRSEEVMGMRGEIASRFNVEQGNWVGRLKSEQLFMLFREGIGSENILYANGKTFDTLAATDTLNMDDIIALGTIMGGRGGLPAEFSTINKNIVERNAVISAKDSLFSLKMDPNYRALLQQTVEAGAAKVPFRGGYVDVDGHFIREYKVVEHDGEGAIGSPLLPMARLGVDIAAGTTAFDIMGGGNPVSAAKTKKTYFRHFPNHAYAFIGNTDPKAGGVTLLGKDNNTHYVLVINPPNAAVDPGKIGMYGYTVGNDGNKITITERLGASAAGVRATTVGSVVWNTGVWSGLHTDVHPEGSLIVPCNAKGQVYADTLMLGRRCAYRGYGKYRNQRAQDDKEGKFLMERYIVTVFGQALRKDRLGRVPGVFRMRHAVRLPGINLPEVA